MQINIMGTRGIPGAHGGFETFAQQLALFLVAGGHDVLVYCQPVAGAPNQWVEDEWCGVKRRSYIPKRKGSAGTIEFDFACVLDVLQQPGVDLVLGYNTGIFNIIERIRGRRVVMNMDGIEWKRAKWSLPAKIWFFLNEVAGANICNVPIADHPEIARHISKRCLKKPVMIPYGADVIDRADVEKVRAMGLEPDKYFISISRIEPENSILELVQAYSTLNTKTKCVILGKIDTNNKYQMAVKSASGSNVVFAGAIYDSTIVSALRFYCRAYFHGHQVGGTNPSLVEALGAGNAVICHDNVFNRWTAGEGQLYFSSIEECSRQLKFLLEDSFHVESARRSARERHEAAFKWSAVLKSYETVLCLNK